MGVLPLSQLGLEVGFDLMLPSEDPALFHGKLALLEDGLFRGQPGVSFGVFGVGTGRSGASRTDYDILYGVAGKTIPWIGGYVAVGGYYALGEHLFTLPDESVNRAGLLASLTAPDIVIGLPWLQKIVFAADVQTGQNAFGAAGLAAAFYFTPALSLITGPICFLEPSVQPAGGRWMWTVQVDVDLDLRARPAAQEPAPAASQTPPRRVASERAQSR